MAVPNRARSSVFIHIESPAISLAAAEQIYVGHECGQISIIDPRTSSTVTTIDSHPFGVGSVAVHDQLLVTSGFTMRQGVKLAENTLRIYDMRTMKMVIPIPVPLGASSVKFGNEDHTVYALSPLRYQIVAASVNTIPPSKEAIHSDNLIATGSMSGSVQILQKGDAAPSINNMSIPLSYPSAGSVKVENRREEALKFSDNVGSDKYWGRTKPVFDNRLYSLAQRVGGLGFVRNDRGVIPNTVHLVASAGMATASLQGSLESLNVSSENSIHIQHFLKAASPILPPVEHDMPAFALLAETLRALYRLFPSLCFKIACRDCGFSKSDYVTEPIILISKVQSNFAKSLANSLETASKQRIWCDRCHGYRDFVTEGTPELQSVIFIIDPAAYRSHHVIEKEIGSKKGLLPLLLKGMLLESHGPGNINLKAIIKQEDVWITCNNELCTGDGKKAEKQKAIALLYEQSSGFSYESINLPPALIQYGQKLIGVDAEYVFYEKAQIEFSSDGSQQIVKPKKARLARLSLLEAKSDAMVIDEFVTITSGEIIEDYCTAISGIRSEDLLPGISKHKLNCRKSLIDAKCTFIGHGLDNDFRVFNISIPKVQIIDTVELFHIQGNRCSRWLSIVLLDFCR
ncbi:PAB-dependent poly(A)-specific ribonuclease subunit PAN2 [Paramicrosporidium saccamoebae]|uniref:PAB-dependent poly(A)-specific ribonuclease subunit PAN2 n=1 Tax=Paramicrosporidium saccamoebae TaxID=1246581 RepID=A0A2H9TM15_9FUNG|nr:PAB-dependent poly(A)-specific ribonuclease subunit PAN2 [Paramicrosporidium saccamoebae]